MRTAGEHTNVMQVLSSYSDLKIEKGFTSNREVRILSSFALLMLVAFVLWALWTFLSSDESDRDKIAKMYAENDWGAFHQSSATLQKVVGMASNANLSDDAFYKAYAERGLCNVLADESIECSYLKIHGRMKYISHVVEVGENPTRLNFAYRNKLDYENEEQWWEKYISFLKKVKSEVRAS